MRLPISISAMTCLLLMASTGCSKQGSDKTENEETESATVAEATDSSAAMDTTETQKTFPIRDPKNKIVTISTDFGDLVLELYRDVAPAHADSFVARTVDGFYNNLTFHRVMDHFMIQGGDPKGDGTGRADYLLPAEFSQLPHNEGTLSMARGGDPNSASCQFFICLERSRSTAGLDGKYTIFGQLLKGYDVLYKIGKVEVVASPSREKSKPKETIYMKKVFLSDADGKPLQ